MSSVRTAGLTAAPSPVRQLLFETGDFLFQLELLALELGQANRVGHGAVDLVIDGLLQAVMFFDERFEMRRCIHRDLLLAVRSAFRSEEHTSELQSLMRISYAVFCLKKKNKI